MSKRFSSRTNLRPLDPQTSLPAHQRVDSTAAAISIDTEQMIAHEFIFRVKEEVDLAESHEAPPSEDELSADSVAPGPRIRIHQRNLRSGVAGSVASSFSAVLLSCRRHVNEEVSPPITAPNTAGRTGRREVLPKKRTASAPETATTVVRKIVVRTVRGVTSSLSVNSMAVV